ncbi:cupin domain-containing protein [Paracoccus yeei]
MAGEGSFTPDGGARVAFRAGDSIWFDANTQGEWIFARLSATPI